MSKDGFMKEKKSDYTDLATVESQRNDLAAEEFPEGAYGSAGGTEEYSEELGKRTPWREDQRAANAYAYENRELHQDRPRRYPDDQADEEN